MNARPASYTTVPGPVGATAEVRWLERAPHLTADAILFTKSRVSFRRVLRPHRIPPRPSQPRPPHPGYTASNVQKFASCHARGYREASRRLHCHGKPRTKRQTRFAHSGRDSAEGPGGGPRAGLTPKHLGAGLKTGRPHYAAFGYRRDVRPHFPLRGVYRPGVD